MKTYINSLGMILSAPRLSEGDGVSTCGVEICLVEGAFNAVN